MIKVIKKSESLLMKVLSWILFFNPKFMTDFTTTIGNTIYLPSSADKWTANSTKVILAHEYTHIFDSQKDKLFPIKYLFPQILSLLFFTAIPFTWFAFLFLLFLLPAPAYWRKYYEIRGYTITLATWHYILRKRGLDKEVIKEILLYKVNSINRNFTTSDYYYMWPMGVKEELGEIVETILEDDIFQKDDIYKKVYDVVVSKPLE